MKFISIIALNGLILSAFAQGDIASAITQHKSLQTPKNNSIAKVAAAIAANPKLVSAAQSGAIGTLFAPTDAAFDAAVASLGAQASNASLIEAILTYHTTGSKFVPSVFREILNTLLVPQKLVADLANSNVTIRFGLGSAQVLESITAGNGIIHVVDKVLIPPSSVSSTAKTAGLNQLVGALNATKGSNNKTLLETVDSLSNITVFAPTDAAFAALGNTSFTNSDLNTILTYHVLPSSVFSPDLLKSRGSSLTVKMVNGQNLTVSIATDGVITLKGSKNAKPVRVIQADVLTNNGVVHVIDGVLLPDNVTLPASVASSAMTSGLSAFAACAALIFALI